MKFIIDSANYSEIDELVKYGINRVTANPSLYKKNDISMLEFLEHYSSHPFEFISGEVMGEDIEELRFQVKKILEVRSDSVIKINFSKAGLQLCHELSKKI